ncbi:MAG: methyltransferase domain-containing protein [Nitrospirae bacterium]|nr:methyltransferase domain-containing protein [Nitrospirota bacterium]
MSNIREEAKKLREMWGGFRASRVLITANNYRVYDLLKDYQTARSVSEKLKIDLRATEILLDALTSLGLLKKSGDKYKNLPISNHLLTKESPYYQGDMIRHADYLWRNWSELDEVIKTGNPVQRARDYETFIRGMHNLATLKAKSVIKSIDLKGIKTALDLGGGPGTYSMEMAKMGIKVTLFDYPEAIRIAKKIIEEKNVKGINFISGDFIIDDIGSDYDLIFASQILHSYSEKDNILVLKKCKDALNNKGKVVIHEFYISEDRTRPVWGTLFSVNMLVNTTSGRTYTSKEIRKWLIDIGFKNIKERLLDDTVLIEGKIFQTLPTPLKRVTL